MVLAIIGVLFALAAPSFRRSLEQSHADIAGANLRAIWTAQRLYWLENRTFCDSLSKLESLELIDPTVVAASAPYAYVLMTATETTFTARASREESDVWEGHFLIDEAGAITGSVSSPSSGPITPGFLD